ncbi:unnamed protein product [Gordionus sp. m RMFG-2023]
MAVEKILFILPITNNTDQENSQAHKKIILTLYITQIVIIVITNSIYFWILYEKYILNWLLIVQINLGKLLNLFKCCPKLKIVIEKDNNKNKHIIASKLNFVFPVQCYFSLRACGDIMSALISMPIQIHIFYSISNREHSNLSNYLLCVEMAILWYFKEVFVNMSSFSIMAIAVDRFWAIRFPFKYKSNKKHIKWSIIIIILTVLVLPTFFPIIKIFDKTSYTPYCKMSCRPLRINLIWLLTTGYILFLEDGERYFNSCVLNL